MGGATTIITQGLPCTCMCKHNIISRLPFAVGHNGFGAVPHTHPGIHHCESRYCLYCKHRPFVMFKLPRDDTLVPSKL